MAAGDKHSLEACWAFRFSHGEFVSEDRGLSRLFRWMQAAGEGRGVGSDLAVVS